jgi:hypothetical protein
VEGRIAGLRVVCRARGFDDTANLVEWALGYPVVQRDLDPLPTAITRSLIVATRFTYVGANLDFVNELGLNVVERLAGVLSFTVVPLELDTAGSTLGSSDDT